MKALQAKITKPINLEGVLNCIDNTGAKELKLISVVGYKGRLRRIPKAGIADVIVCSVTKGKEKLRHTIVYAVVVRQKKEFRRIDGTRVKFTDNAAILVNPKTYEPTGTEIRSVIAKEAVERFSVIGKIASIVL
ncbi:MAG: uL14 family ribosomal protein [Candidatus Aenigmatarchaeota archaeon]